MVITEAPCHLAQDLFRGTSALDAVDNSDCSPSIPVGSHFTVRLSFYISIISAPFSEWVHLG